MTDLKQRVRQGYSRSWVVAKYSKVGLWPSETVVCERFFEEGSHILDLGCGAGRTTIPLHQSGYEVTAVDLSRPMVDQASRFASSVGVTCPLAVADATDLPFRPNTFDGILLSYNGIELIPKEKGKVHAIQEAWRALRPGGHFVFTTHAFEAFNKYAVRRFQRLGLD
ncbi:MAG: hypothetical protein CME19_02380, partial [Gemmatimonadetes bacterium]|nr:hypothetical protein [Gemmatimonadota bacterium]